MKPLLNTLFVNQDSAYLSLDGENVVVLKDGEELARFLLHNFEQITTFGYTGASPALMSKCATDGITLNFMTPSGRFMARVQGECNGNVLLRKEQYRQSDDIAQCLYISRSFLIGKLYNSRSILKRMKREYPLRLDANALEEAIQKLDMYLQHLPDAPSIEILRGLEGKAAVAYFSVFDQLIFQKKDFFFHERNRRPPLDRMNCLLSFCYALLANDVASALQGVGLDPYVGFLHTDRPGRISLALDCMEELRSIMADRVALSLVNRKQIRGKHFIQKINGAVLMTDEGRRIVLQEWHDGKEKYLTHPFLGEKIKWGLVPHAQALLLARYIRGDLDAYPPFLWE